MYSTDNDSQAAPPAASKFGNSVYDQIGALVKQHTGEDATLQDVSQWGTNVDPQYMQKISGAIANSPKAQAYRQSQTAQPAAPPQGAPTAPPATGSPVSPDGKIPPQQAMPAGGGYQAPTAFKAQPPEGRTLAPTQLDQTPLGTYQGAQFNVTAPQAYTPGQLSPAYQADQISQFTAPDQSGVNNQQNALVSAILTNPQTLSPSIIAQMKEAQKGDALLMQKQAQQGIDQSAASRGVLGGRNAGARTGQLQTDVISQILNNNRNIDISAAQTNRGDELNALNASEGIASGQLGRATQGYGAQLQGQSTQAGANQAASASGLQRSIAGEQNKQSAFDSQFRNTELGFNVQQANADQAYKAFQSQTASQQDSVQRALAQFGINQGVAQNAQQNYATDIGTETALEQMKQWGANFGEGQRQFNNTLGFNYNQLDQNGQMQLLNWLMSQGGGGNL